MATSNSGEGDPKGVETLANLDEVEEGDHIVSRNYRFAPVGANVPIRVDFRYDSEAPPSQPLAVSQLFHLIFVAHSDGLSSFCYLLFLPLYFVFAIYFLSFDISNFWCGFRVLCCENRGSYDGCREHKGSIHTGNMHGGCSSWQGFNTDFVEW